jgi:hypothetical protein
MTACTTEIWILNVAASYSGRDFNLHLYHSYKYLKSRHCISIRKSACCTFSTQNVLWIGVSIQIVAQSTEHQSCRVVGPS